MTVEEIEKFEKQRNVAWALFRNRLRLLTPLILGNRVPLHRNENCTPFFIVGSGRCGTTLLRRILQANQTIHIPPESYVFADVVKTFASHYALLPWPHLIGLVLSTFEYQLGFETWLEGSLRPLALRLRDTALRDQSLAHIIDRLYRYHAELLGKDVSLWGDKTPLNTFFMEEIKAVFPQAKFIHLVRDGLDVVSSMLKAKLAPDLRSAALRWKAAVRRARKFGRQSPERYLEVRYEVLVERPDEIIRAICEFLSVPYSHTMIESLEHVRDMGDLGSLTHLRNAGLPISPEFRGKGKQHLSETEQREVVAVIGRDLTEFGYLVPKAGV